MTDFERPSQLSAAERKELLGAARSSIGWVLGQCAPPPLEPRFPTLLEPAGAFVSLYISGRLRGCVGSILPERSVFATVIDMAHAAAFEDRRFLPVSPDEWRRLEIEISRLGAMNSARPDEIEPGTHGALIIRGDFRGLLLPQVAERFHFDRTAFLRALAQKAGLPPDAWLDPDTQLFRFEAEVFGDSGLY